MKHLPLYNLFSSKTLSPLPVLRTQSITPLNAQLTTRSFNVPSFQRFISQRKPRQKEEKEFKRPDRRSSFGSPRRNSKHNGDEPQDEKRRFNPRDRKRTVEDYVRLYGEKEGRAIWDQLKRRESLRDSGIKEWNPLRKLSRDEMQELRSLYETSPTQNGVLALSKQFGISPEAVKRILHSKWEPKQDDALRQDTKKFLEKKYKQTKGSIILQIKEEAHLLGEVVKIFEKDPKDLEAIYYLQTTANNIVAFTKILTKGNTLIKSESNDDANENH